MVKIGDAREDALALFRRQLDCLIRDDKTEQMKLYADDLVYEFPFANDRPRRIEGKAAFFAVMTPLWEAARRRGVRIANRGYEFHLTDEAGLYVARFILDVSVDGKTVPIEFVQFIRVRDGLIVQASEYFDPQARSQAVA